MEEDCQDFEKKVCTTTFEEQEIMENCDAAIQARCNPNDEDCQKLVRTVKKNHIATFLVVHSKYSVQLLAVLRFPL